MQLRQHGNMTGQLPPAEGSDVPSENSNRPLVRPQHAAHGLEERTAAAAIGPPDDGRDAARFNGKGNIAQDIPASQGKGQMLCRNGVIHGCHTSFRRRNKKNGAPIKAMIKPAGSSTGANSTRASVSLSVTTAMPSKAEPGMI